MRKIFYILIFFSLTCPDVYAQKPTIVSLDKQNGPMNDIVAIQGSEFGTDPAKIKVFFGASAAAIKNISNQLIEVRTPPGATYDNISVSNTTAGLTGYSTLQYFLNFNGLHGLTTANFNTQADFNAESGLYDLCLCDFNGDNKVDVATASDNSNSLAILQNGSTVASFSFVKNSMLINAKSLHVTCGDLNGDGKPDLAVSEGGDGDRVFIFRNTGAFTFNIQFVKLTGRKVKRIAIADLDLDGKAELVVTDKGSNTITILPNQSTASTITFGAPISISVPGAASTDALEIKDLNGNGLPEIVTSQFLTTSSNIFICDNKSTPGTFNLTDITTLNITNTIVNIRVGDIDGDSKPDIVATRLLGSDVSIFLNQSTPTQLGFAAPVSVLTSVRPWGLDFGDLDGDGKTDIAVSSIDPANKSITILNNESSPGAVSFKPMFTVPATYINRHIKIGDMDGDGKPDLVFASIDDNNLGVLSSKISVIRNKSCFVPTVIPAGPLTICTGFPLRLTSTIGGGVTYDWKVAGNPTPVKSGPDPFLDVTASGDYTVTANAEGGACAKISNTVSVTVTAGSSLSGTANATSNSPICKDNTLNLQVTEVGATKYNWRGPNGFTATTTTASTVSIPNFTLDKAGVYIVEMIVGTCVAQVDSTTVEAISIPNFTVAFSGAALVCQGSAKNISVSPVMSSGFTYQWSEKTAGTLAGQTNPTLAVTSTGEYSAKVISVNPGCAPVETPLVKITAVTSPVAAFTPSATSSCVGQVVTFTNQSTVDAQATTSYEWNFGDTKTSAAVSPTNTYSQAGTFQVKLKVSYQGGECLNEITKPITVINSPPISMTAPDNIFKLCTGDTLRLGVTGDTFTNYSWSTGATTPSIVINEAKEYAITVTTAAGCIIEVRKTIEPVSLPTVTASAEPSTIKVGEKSMLTATGGLTYIWHPGLTLSDSATANPVATPLQTTVYTVSGKDINGCRGEASVEITVTGTSALNFITPKNYFSPNDHNGINDYWTIANIDSFPGCAVAIYNDNGAKVFEAKPYINNWDGSYKGSKLPGGVYYYVIRCDGESKTKTGSITLLK